MSKFNGRGNPYVKTPVGVTPKLTPGQWVNVGHVKPGRFVRYNEDGSAYILYPVGRGRKAKVSTAAFRLACEKPLSAVLSRVNVVGRVVDQPAEPTTSNDPLGQAVAVVNSLLGWDSV